MASQAGRDTVQATADETTEKAGELVDQGTKVAANAAEATRDQASRLSGTAGDLYAKARDQLDELPANMSDAAAAGERLMMRGRQRLDHGVRKQPLEALLLAGAIGYLVGWATARG